MEPPFEGLVDWFKSCLVPRENNFLTLEALALSFKKHNCLDQVDKSSLKNALETAPQFSTFKIEFVKKKQKGKRHQVLKGFQFKTNKSETNCANTSKDVEQERDSTEKQSHHVSVITHSKSLQLNQTLSEESFAFNEESYNDSDNIGDQTSESDQKFKDFSQDDYKTSSPVDKVLEKSFEKSENLKPKAKKTLMEYLDTNDTTSSKGKEEIIYLPKNFKFREESKESSHYNNLVFSLHFENFKSATPLNLPSNYSSFEHLLEDMFKVSHDQSKEVGALLIKAKNSNNHIEQKLKAFLCSSFTPVPVGNAVASSVDYLFERDLLPQFTVFGKKNSCFQCEVCTIYNEFLKKKGKKATSKGTGVLSGFRQVYEHACTNHHKNVLNWLKESKKK